MDFKYYIYNASSLTVLGQSADLEKIKLVNSAIDLPRYYDSDTYFKACGPNSTLCLDSLTNLIDAFPSFLDDLMKKESSLEEGSTWKGQFVSLQSTAYQALTFLITAYLNVAYVVGINQAPLDQN